MLGDINSYNETDTTKWDSNFTIADSVIRNMPVEYTGATGLFAAYVQGATIEHNHCKAATSSRVQSPLGRSAASKRQGGCEFVPCCGFRTGTTVLRQLRADARVLHCVLQLRIRLTLA